VVVVTVHKRQPRRNRIQAKSITADRKTIPFIETSRDRREGARGRNSLSRLLRRNAPKCPFFPASLRACDWSSSADRHFGLRREGPFDILLLLLDRHASVREMGLWKMSQQWNTASSNCERHRRESQTRAQKQPDGGQDLSESDPIKDGTVSGNSRQCLYSKFGFGFGAFGQTLSRRCLPLAN
jgi:hypothetical protein